MVSLTVKDLTIEIAVNHDRKTTLKYTHNLVVDDVTINWGRQSLFAAPRKRSATITVRFDQSWGRSYWEPLLRARLIIKRGSDSLFVGFIDTIAPRLINQKSNRWLLALTAVEAHGWRENLAGKMTTRAAWPGLLESSIKLQSKAVKPYVVERLNQEVRFNPPPTATQITYLDAWGAIVATRPLTFPIWNADYSVVQPSIYQKSFERSILLPGNMVSAKMPIIDAAHQPQTVKFSTDGSIYGAKSSSSPWATFRAFGSRAVDGRDYSHIIEVPTLYSVQSWPDSFLRNATQLLQAQQHAPREITISDEKEDQIKKPLEKLAFKRLFNPIEDGISFAIDDGRDNSDPVRRLYGTRFLYSPIGGRLHVTRKITRHHMTCIITGDDS